MKLVIAVVQGKDEDVLLGELRRHEFSATAISSAGGFLRESNVTLLMGVKDSDVPAVLSIVARSCEPRTRFVNPLLPIVEPGSAFAPSPVEVLIGGATVFVLPVSHYEQLG
jgi:uncharacterized protein YaaQ